MNSVARKRIAAFLWLLSATILLLAGFGVGRAFAAPRQDLPSQNSGFVGQWCAQGDPTKTTSISANGPFFSLTNEQGSTSSGHIQGMNRNVIVADQWQFVQGTLSSDGSRINWSNGTYWARCNQGGGGGGGGNHRLPNLQGTWYRDGNHSLACSIQQNRKNLTFTNESGQSARGSFLGSKNVTANWGGQTINGTLVNNAGRINWDNGTSWSR
jgi:hypothetical protein